MPSFGILAVVNDIEEWWSSGDSVVVRLSDTDRTVFVRRVGSGPAITMLHGFPSSSHDWARVVPRLAERHALLLPDLLGFGASEKPAEHAYSLCEQADLVEALWALEGITSTIIVAHDYAVSVAQELLARRAEDGLRVDLAAVHLLNGALYPELARLEPGQQALLDPDHGPQLSAGITEELFVAGLKPTFAAGFDAERDSADIWRATARDGGQAILYRLIRYVADRAVHGERWIAALERTDVPVGFVWGMLDPVSGAHMAKRLRERLPAAPFLALKSVGHWPSLEAPERVAAAVLGE
jgi:pimeloyl-ACP methyl ester carboxylesterase